jgi:Domain of unknown function (DUF4375)
MDRCAGFSGVLPIASRGGSDGERSGMLQASAWVNWRFQPVESFAGPHASRRAIVKAWRKTASIPGTVYLLADLGWVESYSGQAVDEILSFQGTEGVQSLLFIVEQAIQEKVKLSGPLKMTGLERMVLSVMALSREVGNGGYKQFFRNYSRRFGPAIVDDLVRIGCTEIADITQRPLDALDLLKLNVAEIEAAMARENVQRKPGIQTVRYRLLGARRTFRTPVCLRESAPSWNYRSNFHWRASDVGPRTPGTFVSACRARSNGGSAPRTFRGRPLRSGR